MIVKTTRFSCIRLIALAVGLTGTALIFAASFAEALQWKGTSVYLDPVLVSALGLGFVASMLGMLTLWLPLHLADGLIEWQMEHWSEETIKEAFAALSSVLVAALIHFLAVNLYSLE